MLTRLLGRSMQPPVVCDRYVRVWHDLQVGATFFRLHWTVCITDMLCQWAWLTMRFEVDTLGEYMQLCQLQFSIVIGDCGDRISCACVRACARERERQIDRKRGEEGRERGRERRREGRERVRERIHVSALELTPSLPQPVIFPGSKVHTYVPPNSIFDGPVTNLPSILCILIEILSRAHAVGAKKP